ncbi:helix-turn-helix domain-containing protein [Sporosarcina sp. NPDC096371]|uniref:helix-turn-helix domain-containing protein n=1 Tax=Sporosarcina sp. NPDC096371 TaxID=3364530 RepID=UPI0037FC1EE1
MGEIIKFYRQQTGLTQEQLGNGICTVSYISKIEREQTSYSAEIIELLAKRLKIDIEKEIECWEGMRKLLDRWHNSMIMCRTKDMEEIKKEVEEIPFISSSRYSTIYQSLLARYYLEVKELNKAHVILRNLEKGYGDLTPFEKSLLRHIWGLYYLDNYNYESTEKYHKALTALKEINPAVYGNPEYFHDLAGAYHWIGSKTAAYIHAEKALKHFKETNNYIAAVKSKAIMLLQIGSSPNTDFQELIDLYNDLIRDSETFNIPDIKKALLNNVAYQYYGRKDYANANKYFNELLSMTNKQATSYPLRLYSYLLNASEGELLSRTVMMTKVQEGMEIATKFDNSLHKILLQILAYSIDGQHEQYYEFLESTALPYFQSSEHASLKKGYSERLYNYYMEMEQYEKAARILKI